MLRLEKNTRLRTRFVCRLCLWNGMHCACSACVGLGRVWNKASRCADLGLRLRTWKSTSRRPVFGVVCRPVIVPAFIKIFGAHECRGREQKTSVEGTGCMQDLCCIALVTTVEIGVELGACRHAHTRSSVRLWSGVVNAGCGYMGGAQSDSRFD